ncbi:unnamed protein product [Prunus armeniaca]|uniref:Uncharacterized protein n=1 Tax=Prunus armeniaca TaxID=36596 RepID=A0A6J5Y7D1_PRUAR|nr:unnamed protein product [Prunus armeniaca]
MAWAKGFWRNEETSMETVKKFLEKEGEMAMTMDGLPDKFFESSIMEGIKVDLLEPGRTICFFKVTPTTLRFTERRQFHAWWSLCLPW